MKMVFGGKFRIRRCNSKASYLPRQNCDKLNITDPDHGSYKLTLTSNEDSVNQHNNVNVKEGYLDDNSPHIISTKCNNLPDVLPLGVKLHSPTPSSPTSNSSSSPLRYGSNNNLTNSYYMNRQNGSLSPSAYNNYNRSPSYDTPSPKYMSQSTIDLMKTHTIFEQQQQQQQQQQQVPDSMLSPAQSESNLNSPKLPVSPSACSTTPVSLCNRNDYISQTSPVAPSARISTPLLLTNINRPASPAIAPSTRKEFMRTDVVRKLSLEERDPGEGRIVRAELVNTVLSSSPSPTTKLSDDKSIIRKDSIRENIEKISQLQSKLMSAHVIENIVGSDKKLMGYTAKTVKIETQIASIETVKSNQEMTKPLPPPLPATSPPELDLPVDAIDTDSLHDKISQMEPEVDGLKLMQKSELTLRVNPPITPTNEVASQTECSAKIEQGVARIKIDEEEIVTKTTLQPRQKLLIEFECDNLVTELVSLLSANDKLLEILAPKICKTAKDYVGILYNENLSSPQPSTRDIGTSTPTELFNGCELSESKIELQCNGVEIKLVNGGRITPDANCLLTKKKEELLQKLNRKLYIFTSEQTILTEETLLNDSLGTTLTSKLSLKLRSIDSTKLRTFIDDIGHITSLLLSLSGRLAKADNFLINFMENNSEKRILEMKRNRLLEQLEEAKRLKEDIDRRGSIVCKILEQNLTNEEYAEFDYFINMKAKLIVDSKNLAEQMKQTEEQLSALKETLVQSDC